MSRLPRLAALSLVAMLALSACDSDGSNDGAFNIDEYTGTYRGTATLTLDSGTTTTSTAPVTVTVTKSGTNVVTATIDAGVGSAGGDDPAPLVFPGTYSSTGALFTAAAPGSSLAITVDDGGDIGGSGNVDLFGVAIALRPSGRITSSRFSLDVGLTVTSGNADVPTGSTGSAAIAATR